MKTWIIKKGDTAEKVFNALTELRLAQRKAEIVAHEGMARIKEAEFKKSLFFELAEKHLNIFPCDMSLRITKETDEIIELSEIDTSKKNGPKIIQTTLEELLNKLGGGTIMSNNGLGKILGIYYLHENGDLIWKPRNVFVGTTVEAYLDWPKNNLIIKYWELPVIAPADPLKFITDFLLNAIELSKNKARTLLRAAEILSTNEVVREVTR